MMTGFSAEPGDGGLEILDGAMVVYSKLPMGLLRIDRTANFLHTELPTTLLLILPSLYLPTYLHVRMDSGSRLHQQI